MSGGMPYQLEKGPTLSVAESMLNRPIADRIALLTLMRPGVDATASETLPTLDSSTLDAGPLNTEALRVEHMEKHWFGKSKVGGSWVKQSPLDEADPTPTGYWNQWYGDADAILREAFTRALEIALGIDHGAAIPAEPLRDWPIQVFWRCPAPWLEAWVTWASSPGGDGQVTVHLHTPSHDGSALLLSPIRQGPDRNQPDYLDDPQLSSAPEGMWVVAHAEQMQLPFYSTVSAASANDFRWPAFGPFVESRGPIVCVQPNEKDGGVLANKRAYVPT